MCLILIGPKISPTHRLALLPSKATEPMLYHNVRQFNFYLSCYRKLSLADNLVSACSCISTQPTTKIATGANERRKKKRIQNYESQSHLLPTLRPLKACRKSNTFLCFHAENIWLTFFCCCCCRSERPNKKSFLLLTHEKRLSQAIFRVFVF